MTDVAKRIAGLSPEKRALFELRLQRRSLFSPSSSASPVVKIQPGDGRRPFFCVHPSGGNVLCYVEMAHCMGADQPFYGIQSPALYSPQHSAARVEEMAARYIAAMREVRPGGPYLLGGWSMGGLVAYEMARQLVEKGQEVALLGLIDMWVITEEEKIEVDSAMNLAAIFGPYLRLSVDELRRYAPDDQIAYVLRLARAEGLIGSDVGTAEARRILDVFIINDKAAQEYVPKPFDGCVTLFRALDPRQHLVNSHHDDQDSTLGWGALAAKGVEVHLVPGNHDNVVLKPHVETLASRLRQCLDQVQAG